MKSLSLAGISMLCCLLPVFSKAQSIPPVKQTLAYKPALFSHLPDKIETRILLLEKIFSATTDVHIKVPLTDDIFFAGAVVEIVKKNEWVTSINIRSSNFEGALLTLSKIKESETSVNYTGRIVSIGHSDAFVLAKENGRFYFVKKQQSLLIAE